MAVELFDIKGDKFSLSEKIKLSSGLTSIDFSKSSNHLVAIRKKQDVYYLVKIDLKTKSEEILYSSKEPIGLRGEVTENVFLVYEKIAKYEFKANWILIKNGERAVLSDGLMTNPDIVKESVISFNGKGFFGTLFGENIKFTFNYPKRNFSSARCAGDTEISCLFEFPLSDTDKSGLRDVYLASTMGSCKVPNVLANPKYTVISQNGKIVIVNARKNNANHSNGMYLISYKKDECIINEIFLTKE